MRYLVLLGMLVFLNVPVCAFEMDKTAAFDFATISLDARAVALGGGGSLYPTAGTAHWNNPALLGASDRTNFAGAYSPYIADIKLGGITGAYHFSNGIVVAPSFKYFSVGEIEELDEKGDPLEQDVEPLGLTIGLSVGYKWISNLSSGLTVNFVYEHLTEEIVGLTDNVSASALMFDGGIYFTPGKYLALSAGFRNLGIFLQSYEDDESRLPSSAYTGIRYYARGNMSMNLQLEAEKRIYHPLQFVPGIEFLLYKEIVALRIGTSFSTEDASYFFSILKSDPKEKHEYSKSDAQIIALGGGVKVPVKDYTIFFDLATTILADGMGPQLFFSGGFSF